MYSSSRENPSHNYEAKRYLPYGITQGYLPPPDISECALL